MSDDFVQKEITQQQYRMPDHAALEARIAELEALVRRAQLLIDPCYPRSHGEWQMDARALLEGEKPTNTYGGNRDD